MAGSLHQDFDEFNRLIGLLGDIADGLESAQVLYADSLIEAQIADLRYARERLAKLIEQSAHLDEAT